jgi:hypothetical protein
MQINFEQNKKDLLNKISAFRKKDADAAQPSGSARARDVVIFGAHREKERPIAGFHDVESVFNYCLDSPVRWIIADMDPPTNAKSITDLFSAVKSIKPDIQFILLTKYPRTTTVRVLTAKSAIMFEKPFKMAELLHLIDPEEVSYP